MPAHVECLSVEERCMQHRHSTHDSHEPWETGPCSGLPSQAGPPTSASTAACSMSHSWLKGLSAACTCCGLAPAGAFTWGTSPWGEKMG